LSVADPRTIVDGLNKLSSKRVIASEVKQSN
jgi:hypothetical protein